MKCGRFGLAVGLAACLGLVACQVLKDPTDDESQVSDGTASQVAVAQLSDVTSGESLTSSAGYALHAPALPGAAGLASRWLAEWLTERSAVAAGINSCATPTAFLIPGSAGSLSQDYTPPTDCTVAFDNGSHGSLTWAGSWTETFSGADGNCIPDAAAPHGLLVAFGNPSGCSLARGSAGITRTLSIAGGDTVVVERSTAAPSGYKTPLNGDTVTTCQPGVCPDLNVPDAGTRTITMGGTHVRTFRNGKLVWDQTVSTSSPIVVTGWGTSRQITAGTVVTQHNLAHFTSTTSVNAGFPLVFSAADCPYPLSGKLTTMFSGTKYDKKTETVTFGPQCGDATVTRTNNTSFAAALTQ